MQQLTQLRPIWVLHLNNILFDRSPFSDNKIYVSYPHLNTGLQAYGTLQYQDLLQANKMHGYLIVHKPLVNGIIRQWTLRRIIFRLINLWHALEDRLHSTFH